MTYYMISKRAGERTFWEECKASSLIGAKREATARYGSGYRDSVMVVAEGDDITEPRRTLATRRLNGGRWVAAE